MNIPSIFKKFTSVQSTNTALNGSWQRTLIASGVSLHKDLRNTEKTIVLTAFNGFLTQLIDDGFAEIDGDDSYFLTWDALYEVMCLPEYLGIEMSMALPEFTGLSPTLSSRNTLADNNFSIFLGIWLDEKGRSVSPSYLGPVMQLGSKAELMTAQQWSLFKQVAAFSLRPVADHDEQQQQQQQRQAWGQIRRTALAANANMSDFLVKTVILTPERLEISFRKADISDNTVVEVIPGFQGAPSSWLALFDRFDTILNRYDLATDDGGLIQIILSPEVKIVLQEIKRFEGRRLAGSRAQAFLLNPFASLGEAASKVIDEEQFEQARVSAGLSFERFTPVTERNGTGQLEKIGILIESVSSNAPNVASIQYLDDVQLRKFISSVEHAIERELQLVFWDGAELEILGDTPDHLQVLKTALVERSKPLPLITHAHVYDLKNYSARVESVGLEKPYYSSYIAKKKEDESWFPENVLPVIAFTPSGADEPVAVPINDMAMKQLREKTTQAASVGEHVVELPWLPLPMPLSEALRIIDTFDEVLVDVQKKIFDPEKSVGKSKPPARKTLVLLSNIVNVEYAETRRQAMTSKPKQPRISIKFNPNFKLLDHQIDGVAKLQHLFGLRHEYMVRGMVLADDMGLGKTLQLLSLMTSIVEDNPKASPMLLVAPVSLLENWKEEAEKFFPGGLKILTAYGDNLRHLRVPQSQIDERLRNEDGLVKFLQPGWVGNAQLVLTTYETLRDLEFSFAAQHWSLMVCDEAQRIKNPAAMVTRSAKKQNAEFKIACTGTPVENTLADLWCLFDFVQAGHLGALNDFGDKYRRPIEIDERDDQGLLRIEELRLLIEPQILRRTKLEVIKDLPKKIVDEGCRNLPLSLVQRNLYGKAVDDFKKRADPNFLSPFKNHLALLHYLRLVCTDPRRHGLTVFKPEPIAQYRSSAPKLDWLLNQLFKIQAASEKVIIFCEFRNIQRLLQHYIEEVFCFQADIINGDTSASSSNSSSRQKRINAFQQRAGFGVIILSPVAVGFGVNIQAANHVIHYTRSWNPAKEDQASDRAWRIGQTKDVYVYYPVVAAKDFTTFDVKLDRMLDKKRLLAGDMLNGSPDISLSEFKVEDVVPGADVEGIDERVTLPVAMRMEWRLFEGLAAAIWIKLGFDTVYCTPGSSDNGVDVVAIRGKEGQLVQTKTSASDERSLNWDTVKEVVAGEAFYRRRHPGVTFKLIGLTNQHFNTQAHENAVLNGVELLEQHHLHEMLQTHIVNMLDVERLIYSDWSDSLLKAAN
jgi:SNF2 family DNA or RNA helicase